MSDRWADMFSAKGCHDDPEHRFSHPFLQVKYESESGTTVKMLQTALIFTQDEMFLSSYNARLVSARAATVDQTSFLSALRVSPQAVGMFLGELSCLVVFHILLCRDRRMPEPKMNPDQSFNPFLFFPPAMCDMTATSIMYVGEYVANGQM